MPDWAKLQDRGRGCEHDHHQRDQDDGDRLELTAQIGHRAFLDGACDLDHLGGPLICCENALHQEEPDTDREKRGGSREEEPEPLGPPKGELLIAPFRR
jgi:hypothetical protein